MHPAMARGILLWLLGLNSMALFGGWFNEHKHIGDVAFKRFVAANRLERFLRDTVGLLPFGELASELPIPYARNAEVRELYRGMFGIDGRIVDYSYGDLCGLAADHSVDLRQLESVLLNIDTLFHTIPNGSLFGALDDDVFKALRSHHDALEDGKMQGNYNALPYILLAERDRSHFQHPPDSLYAMLQRLDTSVIELFYRYRSMNHRMSACERKRIQRQLDRCFLRLNNASKYALLHAMAQDRMYDAAYELVEGTPDRFRTDFILGLLYNAFADHFLQDAFASGHLATRRNWRGLDNNGVHDYYCRVGLPVENGFHQRWTTYGDNFYDSTTYRMAMAGELRSLEELFSWFRGFVAGFKAEQQMEAPPAPGERRVPDPLLTAFRDRTILPARWVDTIRSTMGAYRYMPVPLDAVFYQDSIELKQGSKNGMFVEAGWTGSRSSPRDEQTTWHATLCIFSRGWIRPAPGSAFNATRFSRRIESILWAGLSIGYQYVRRAGNIEHQIQGAVHASLYDRICIDVGAGSSVGAGAGHFRANASVGPELKWLSCAAAPSIKYYVAFGDGMTLEQGVRLALRIY